MRRRGSLYRGMDSRPPTAEEHPAVYRSILDRVAELERVGQRREALRVRTTAIEIYSSGWDQSSLARLVELRERADREIARRRRTYALDGT